MSEEQDLAPQEASEDIVTTPVEDVEVETKEPEAEKAEETEAETPSEPEGDEDKERRSRHQRRKETLQRIKADAEDAERRAREAEEAKKRIQENAAKIATPKEGDYKSFEEYQAALSAYHIARGMDEREIQQAQITAENARKDREAAAQRAQAEAQENWATQRVEASQRYTDFEQVISNPLLKISQEMTEVIVSSDAGADVAYYLGKNPDIAEAVSTMRGPELWREMGKIEALASMPKPKTVSSAPEPITPVRSKSTGTRDPDKMTPTEYRRWRESGGSF